MSELVDKYRNKYGDVFEDYQYEAMEDYGYTPLHYAVEQEDV
jgi:hypothetical protein